MTTERRGLLLISILSSLAKYDGRKKGWSSSYLYSMGLPAKSAGAAGSGWPGSDGRWPWLPARHLLTCATQNIGSPPNLDKTMSPLEQLCCRKIPKLIRHYDLLICNALHSTRPYSTLFYRQGYIQHTPCNITNILLTKFTILELCRIKNRSGTFRVGFFFVAMEVKTGVVVLCV